jgi:uncharacterized membrane protein
VVLGLALAGVAVAAYLTLVQTGVVDHPWDPVFGHGSDSVLRSKVSRALPFPDASLGLAAYLAEAVLALTDAGDRWTRRPVLPLAYDALSVGLAGAAVALVLLQAFVVGSWCLLCLVSAALSLAILAVGRLREARDVVHRWRVGELSVPGGLLGRGTSAARSDASTPGS